MRLFLIPFFVTAMLTAWLSPVLGQSAPPGAVAIGDWTFSPSYNKTTGKIRMCGAWRDYEDGGTLVIGITDSGTFTLVLNPKQRASGHENVYDAELFLDGESIGKQPAMAPRDTPLIIVDVSYTDELMRRIRKSRTVRLRAAGTDETLQTGGGDFPRAMDRMRDCALEAGLLAWPKQTRTGVDKWTIGAIYDSGTGKFENCVMQLTMDSGAYVGFVGSRYAFFTFGFRDNSLQLPYNEEIESSMDINGRPVKGAVMLIDPGEGRFDHGGRQP